MNEQIDSKTNEPAPGNPQRSISSTWRLIFLAAPFLVFLCAALFLAASVPMAKLIPLSTFEFLAVPYMFFGSLFSFLGPIFGAYDLVKSLNQHVSVNPLYVLFIWLGVLVVNGFVVFAMCMTAMPFLGL